MEPDELDLILEPLHRMIELQAGRRDAKPEDEAMAAGMHAGVSLLAYGFRAIADLARAHQIANELRAIELAAENCNVPHSRNKWVRERLEQIGYPLDLQ